MKRWTNGLPGATKRLGAMMAQRGFSASQPRMRADTHDGPEQMLHVRGLIHCCSSHVRRSWSFCLATHGRAIHAGTLRLFAKTQDSVAIGALQTSIMPHQSSSIDAYAPLVTARPGTLCRI